MNVNQNLLQPILLRLLPVCLLVGALSVMTPAAERPNVVLIAIDDLNDWIGCLGGHPQAQTPHIDRLAQRGVLFANAHCQSPVCNPSRASMMTSLYPETTGVYFLSPGLESSPVAQESVVLPQRFVQEGYAVSAAGKLFHKGDKKYFPTYGGNFGGFGPLPKRKLTSFKGVKLWDWGAFPDANDEMPDHKIAAWALNQLGKTGDQPFLMGVGFYRPHVPQYAPQEWFDLYPAESVQMPAITPNDLADISEYAVSLTRDAHVAPTHEWVTSQDEWMPLVRSYLACVTFVDHQVGKVLDAIDAHPDAANTYIVLYADHGFHLGEKQRWAKRSLWEDSTRVPMIIAGPGIQGGVTCTKSVELIDIYPTVLDLAGLAADPKHEGQSLRPLLDNAESEWPHFARTSFGPGNEAIRSERYRYIRYNDGSEEFYDHNDDPHEWRNLISNPELAPLVEQHRAALPTERHPVLGKTSTGHKAYKAAEQQR